MIKSITHNVQSLFIIGHYFEKSGLELSAKDINGLITSKEIQFQFPLRG